MYERLRCGRTDDREWKRVEEEKRFSHVEFEWELCGRGSQRERRNEREAVPELKIQGCCENRDS